MARLTSFLRTKLIPALAGDTAADSVLREELMYLWGDLAEAYRCSRATPPEASGGCENLIYRIHLITALTGPLSSDQVELPFLLTGMYEKVHAAMGLTVTVPEETLNSARKYVAQAERRRP